MSHPRQNDSGWWEAVGSISFYLNGAAGSPGAPRLSHEGLLGEGEVVADDAGGRIT